MNVENTKSLMAILKYTEWSLQALSDYVDLEPSEIRRMRKLHESVIKISYGHVGLLEETLEEFEQIYKSLNKDINLKSITNNKDLRVIEIESNLAYALLKKRTANIGLLELKMFELSQKVEASNYSSEFDFGFSEEVSITDEFEACVSGVPNSFDGVLAKSEEIIALYEGLAKSKVGELVVSELRSLFLDVQAQALIEGVS